jgi:hypothetical protein
MSWNPLKSLFDNDPVPLSSDKKVSFKTPRYFVRYLFSNRLRVRTLRIENVAVTELELETSNDGYSRDDGEHIISFAP